jgi:hypothetical protein
MKDINLSKFINGKYVVKNNLFYSKPTPSLRDTPPKRGLERKSPLGRGAPTGRGGSSGSVK